MDDNSTTSAKPQQQPVMPQQEQKQQQPVVPQQEQKQQQPMDQIPATHSPNSSQDVDVKPLLQLVEEILQRSIIPNLEDAPKHASDKEIQQDKFVAKFEAFSDTINKLSCEISYACSEGDDAHSTTVSLIKTMSSYSWYAKVVLGLAAFSVTYGEFLLVAEFYSTHPLAKSIGLLKQLPDTIEYSESLKPRFESSKNLIKAMLDVTKCVVHFNELPPEQRPLLVEANDIPVAVYWIIRSVIACASEIIGLIGLANEYIPSKTKAGELSSLTHKVINIRDHFKQVAPNCCQHIDEKVEETNEEKQEEAYLSLRHFTTIHADNLKIVKALIYANDGLPPLLEGPTKKRVAVEVLKGKSVLVLISDLDISKEQLSILTKIYENFRGQPTKPESQYEVVWLPVVDNSVLWTEAKQKVFEALQSMMPWYSVHHPSLMKDPAVVIKYIKDVWHFDKKPILVLLDPEGRVVRHNPLPMICIWESLALPLTREKEEALWEKETWRLKLLVDDINPNILAWITEKKFICLYGGEDIEWIRKFTSAARKALKAQIPFEMMYVGKSNPKDRVKSNIDVITTESLSNSLDLRAISLFWIRSESIWYSKMQQGKTIKNDRIMEEIMAILTFDGSEQGWALISEGSTDNTAKAKGDMILKCFQQYDQWKDVVGKKGFIKAANDHLQKLQTTYQ